MITISFARHQFPGDHPAHRVVVYPVLNVAIAEREELLAERGLDLTVGKPPFALA
jgi:hypothetical protein